MDAGRGELLPGCSGCFFNSLYIPFSRQSLARLSDTNLKPHFHVLATRTTRSEVEGGGGALGIRRVWRHVESGKPLETTVEQVGFYHGLTR